jgi:hypothetical protein
MLTSALPFLLSFEQFSGCTSSLNDLPKKQLTRAMIELRLCHSSPTVSVDSKPGEKLLSLAIHSE